MTSTTKKLVTALFTLLCLCSASSATAAAQAIVAKIASPLSHTENGNYTLGLNFGGALMNLVIRTGSVINTNTRLVNLNGYPEQSSFRSFQGSIQGEDNSWVRLGVHGDSLSGVISTQGSRYQLSGSASSHVTLNLLSEQSSHSLSSHAPQWRRTQSLAGTTANNTASNQASASAKTNANSETTAISHVVDIAIAVDSQYNVLYDGKGLEKALSIINSVDGIYREEFGIALRVVSALNITERSNDPFDFGSVQIETMLRGLRDYRMQTTHFNEASLVHLFTGNQNNDAPVGLAWIDTACRSDGYDVGLSTPYRHEILLAAHEIAHNLGAMHDSDTTCNIENDKVMWPYISDKTSQNFSTCTRSSVRRSLQNSCHVQTVDLQVSLFENDENSYTATIKNNDAAQSSTSSTLTIELPHNSIATALYGDCFAPANRVECAIGTLLPGAEDHVRVSIESTAGVAGLADAADIAAQEFTASITSNDLPDVTQDNNRASIRTGTFDNNDELQQDALASTDSGANSGDFITEGGGSAPLIAALVLFTVAIRRRGVKPVN